MIIDHFKFEINLDIKIYWYFHFYFRILKKFMKLSKSFNASYKGRNLLYIFIVQPRIYRVAHGGLLLANVLVFSRCSYCYLLYFRINKPIRKQQMVQNTLAHVVILSVHQTDHFFHTLKLVHWLPVDCRPNKIQDWHLGFQDFCCTYLYWNSYYSLSIWKNFR